MNGKKKAKYFPNDWKRWKDLNEEYLPTPTFDEFMQWRVMGWMLPESVCCLIRETDCKTGKVKEYVYQQSHAAEKRLEKILHENQNNEVVLCNHDAVHIFLHPGSNSEPLDEFL